MINQEWAACIAALTKNWPHSAIPDSALGMWGRDLADLPGEQVLVAIEALARDGREHAPNSGQIRAKVTELELDAPDWATVHRLLDALFAYPESALGNGERTTPRADAIARLPAVVGAFVRHVGMHGINVGLGGGSDEARLRAKWESFVAAAQRDRNYAGLPAASGLRRIERVNTPRPLSVAIGELREGRVKESG